MKVIIQIPCYNEEKTLPLVIKELPKRIEGVDKIEILVINDGSTDKTIEVARALGVQHILTLPKQRGLASVFKAGLDRALELGADIIVNTDGDNQYKGGDIPALIAPILHRTSEITIGCRMMDQIQHFSFTKKTLQRFGSYMVRKFSKTTVPDTTSGFRAFSRDAALRVNIFSSYTYTLETLIQAGRAGIAISHIDITTNEKLRESRLIRSIPVYIVRSLATMMRVYLMYEPLRTFVKISMFPLVIGAAFIVRFFVAHFTQAQGGHIQSLIIAAILVIVGSGIITIGLLGDLISANRKLSEDILYRLKKRDLSA
ncbi:MAG: glycosyltransferase [Candidatus Omnitrophota bacterium]